MKLNLGLNATKETHKGVELIRIRTAYFTLGVACSYYEIGPPFPIQFVWDDIPTANSKLQTMKDKLVNDGYTIEDLGEREYK